MRLENYQLGYTLDPDSRLRTGGPVGFGRTIDSFTGEVKRYEGTGIYRRLPGFASDLWSAGAKEVNLVFVPISIDQDLKICDMKGGSLSFSEYPL